MSKTKQTKPEPAELGPMEEFGGQGYLKAGFLGFPKSGKTFTSVILASEIHKRVKSKRPVAFFDTEAGVAYVREKLKEETGHFPVGKKSRSLQDLMAVAKFCEDGASDVLIVDSITHVWRECCESYLKQVNSALSALGKNPRTRLEFQDWSNIKRTWQVWTDWYLNSPVHVIICGRAGFEWDFEENEDTGKKELRKVGVKMKVESEFGFEPSLLVEMERIQEPIAGEHFKLLHRATVLGDRFGILDGKSCDNPTAEFFKPHLALLTPGAANVVDTELKTDHGVTESGDAEWSRERRQRTIYAEEIQGEMVKVLPGQSAVDKQAKAALLQKVFGTTSWTKVENMDSNTLKVCLETLRKEIASMPPKPKEKEE